MRSPYPDNRLMRNVGATAAIVLTTWVAGCEEYLSTAVDAMGQPLATGIGNSLSRLVEALVLNVFI